MGLVRSLAEEKRHDGLTEDDLFLPFENVIHVVASHIERSNIRGRHRTICVWV